MRFRLEGLERRASGGAHPEHVLHGCDAGRVKTQRLVVRRRALQCRGWGVVIVGQEEGRRVGRGVIKKRARWIQVGVGTGAGRASNMLRMVVTLEVVQPEMSALKLPMPLKSSAISLMEETPQ